MKTRDLDRETLRKAGRQHAEWAGYEVALCLFVDWINSDDPDVDLFDVDAIRDALRRLPEPEAIDVFEKACADAVPSR